MYIKSPTAQPGAGDVTRTVAEILAEVRAEGDRALRGFNEKLDGYAQPPGPVAVTQAAYADLPHGLAEDLRFAADNIRRFAERQRRLFTDLEAEDLPGVSLGHRVVPVSACACCVPGGRYPLPSSALMSIIPAKVAGVRRVAACSPKAKGWPGIHPVTLAAMDIAGADEIYCMGGAQAVGAFAFGTETIAPVPLIVGPGGPYVTEAKRQVFGPVGIDFIAGPSEVLIIADHTGQPARIAADLLAQSEHDPLAKGVLLSLDRGLAQAVAEEVEAQLRRLPTGEIAAQAWEANGEIRLCADGAEAARLANQYAPEHLELHLAAPEALVPLLTDYGALFIGQDSAEVFGDYSAGTNHILPTARAARHTGGVWVGTFLKVLTHQRLTPAGAARVAPSAARLAQAEGLLGHKAAAEARMDK
jgi:histidinol dehydrogenase